MDVELTGRKVKITKNLRSITDEGLARIEKIVGRGATAHVIFGSQKQGATAEVTVNARLHTIVGASEAPELSAALRMALEKTEKQALRWKKTRVENKRRAEPIRAVLPAVVAGKAAARGAAKNSVPVNGKSSAGRKTSGVHIVHVPEAVAPQPMTLEEAVKEAESGDREIFVFRDLAGDVKVLHCAGDGIVRLIEVP